MKASLVSIFAQDWHPQKFDRPDRFVIADILGAHGLGGPSFTQGWTWVLERHQLLHRTAGCTHLRAGHCSNAVLVQKICCTSAASVAASKRGCNHNWPWTQRKMRGVP